MTVGVVYNNQFLSKRACFGVDLPGGWYVLRNVLKRQLEPAIELPKPDLKFFVVGNSFIPLNFGDCRFRLGNSGDISDFDLKLLPQNVSDFSVIGVKIIRNQLFYVRSFFVDVDLVAAEGGSGGDRKGWIPEKKMALAVSVLKIEEAKKLSLDELLDERSRLLGVEILSKKELPSGNVEIEWQVYGKRFRTEIRPDTLSVVRAGFCLSGDDRKFTFTNLPTLVKEAVETGVLYIG